jgi:hypothetical protein
VRRLLADTGSPGVVDVDAMAKKGSGVIDVAAGQRRRSVAGTFTRPLSAQLELGFSTETTQRTSHQLLMSSRKVDDVTDPSSCPLLSSICHSH